MPPEGPSPPFDATQLAAHTRWMRALAQRIVCDAADAEDLAQDTLLAAIERPPAAHGGDLRAWLAGAARNLARFQARSRGRRKAHERDAASVAYEPPVDETVVRAEAVRAMLDAVLELDGPTRTAVLLRYQDRLSYRAIAARLGTTPETARKRGSRGLALLRARLVDDERGGDARAPALMTLIAAPHPFALSIAPVANFLVSIKLSTSIAAGAGLALLLGLYLWNRSAGPTGVVSERAFAGQDENSTARGERDAKGLLDTPTMGAARNDAATAVPMPTSPVAARIKGTVHDRHSGRPVVGALIHSATVEAAVLRGWNDAVLTRTDALGAFELPDDTALPDGFVVVSPTTFQLHVDRARIAAGGALALEVMGLGSATVRAIAADGAPEQQAEIEYRIEPVAASDAQLWGWRRSMTAGRTDEEGTLDVRGLPVGTPLQFQLKGEWRSGVTALVDPGTRHVDVVVSRSATCSVRLRCVDPDGAPVGGVCVQWRGTAMDRDFAPDTNAEGVAHLSGFMPGRGAIVFRNRACAPFVAVAVTGPTQDLGDIVIPALVELSGVVVAADGAPAARVYVTPVQFGIAAKHVSTDDSGQFQTTVADAPLVLLAATERWHGGIGDVYSGSPSGRLDVERPTSGLRIVLAASAQRLAARLPAGASTEGVVYSAFDMTPAVDWVPPQPRVKGAPQSMGHEQGIVVTALLPAGTYDLVVRHPELGTGIAAALPTSSTPLEDAPLVTFGNGMLAVELTDTTGTPASGVVLVNHCDDEVPRTGRPFPIAARGAIALEPGSYRVRAEVAGEATQR